MNHIDFNRCRIFLEKMIEQKPDSSELIQAYVKLIEKKLNLIFLGLKQMKS